MKKLFVKCLCLTLFLSCAKVPVTGRRQVNLLPESSMMKMSLTNYSQFLKDNNVVSGSDKRTQMVKSVGAKIKTAVTSYMKTEGLSKRIEGYSWEFNLVEDNTVNAWCMPGGKVVVYTGLMPVAEDEAGLAVVMGHEIAHAIARHGNERMSQQLVTVLGGIGLGVALNDKPEETRNIFLASYGAASTLGILKYSRTHEAEADQMGLIFMAMAGYDPNEAVDFWKRMAQQSGGANVPEFLSTHPSHNTRIQNLESYIPEAMNYYKAAKK